MSRLAIYRGEQFLEEVVLSRAVMGLGRHPDNDIVLDDKTLSRFHARVERRGDRFVVVDLGAQNGLQLNGQRIQGESSLTPGDKIVMGRYIAVFEPPRSAKEKPKNDDLDLDVDLGDLLDDDRTSRARPLAPVPPAAASGSGAKPARKRADPTLVLLFNGMEVSRHPIAPGGTTIGRSKVSDVVISLLGLSRKHARIQITDDGAVVAEDLGSQNGTWVNNQRIDGVKRLRHGDLLNFYDYAVLYLEDGNAEVGFPGAGFKPTGAGLTDELSAQETDRSKSSPASDPRRAAVARVSLPLADSGKEHKHAEARAAADLDLGEGSFLGDEFENPSDDGPSSSLLDEDPLEDIASLLPPDTQAGVVPETAPPKNGARKRAPATDLSDEDDRAAVAAFDEAARFAADSAGTEGEAHRFEERTSSTAGGDAHKRAWPGDADLLKALSNSPESAMVTVEITMGGKPYTQMPLSQTVTRVGSDPRCEMSIPKAAGLAAWHLTLLHMGGAVVLYRAARTAQILLATESVDMALLRDGDMIDLGKVRLKLRIR